MLQQQRLLWQQNGVVPEIKQAVPLAVKVWVGLELAAKGSTNSLVKVLCGAWLILIATSLRFIHMQRSYLVDVGSKFITGMASLSKTKLDGRRRPFRWILPRMGLLKETLTAGTILWQSCNSKSAMTRQVNLHG